jgi:hypothetical protein
MTRTEEARIQAIFQEHLQNAVAQIAGEDGEDSPCWMPVDLATRLAMQCTQTVALMAETEAMTEA